MVKVFHGSGKKNLVELRPSAPESGGQGDTPVEVHPSGLYVSTEFEVADAFAFRDARSMQLIKRMIGNGENWIGAFVGIPVPYIPVVEETVSYVYESECPESDLGIDSDFKTLKSSKRVAHPLPVKVMHEGRIKTWRQSTKILGPHRFHKENGACAYTSDGFIRLLPIWADWNYSQEQLNMLGKWLPHEAVWENEDTKKLFLVSEDGLVGFSPEQIPLEDVTEDVVNQWYPTEP